MAADDLKFYRKAGLMMAADFYKYHALGNDYIVIDPQKFKLDLIPEKIKLLCDRHCGLGSDGVLYGPVFQDAGIGLRIFNPDGSEAEKSGNGIRIFARYFFEAGYISGKCFEIYTPGGKVQVELLNDQASLIRVDMGKITFQSESIPVTGPSRKVKNETMLIGDKSMKVTCLSIGNPHCVIIMPEISKELALKMGPLVENHPMFPKRINMQLVKILDRHNIQIEIWERGAGYTRASGSSSCAAAGAMYELGLIENQVRVHMPGGCIEININPEGNVLMTGTVTEVAKGEFLEDLRKNLYQFSTCI